MIVAIWVNGLQSIKEHEPFLKNIRSSLSVNPYLWAGISAGILLQGSILIFAGDLFYAELPDAAAWKDILGMSAGIFLLLEARKWGEFWYRNFSHAKGRAYE
jgi:Ca2+-transporting ATPase